MRSMNRLHTDPIDVPRSTRPETIDLLTSMPAGKIVPLAFVPLFRQDSAQGVVRIACEMMETKEILANQVKLRFSAWCVPWLALERFQRDRGQFDRSYKGEPQTDNVGAVVVPFFEKQAFGAHGSNPIFRAAGLHGNPTDLANTMYIEAYNAARNHRAKNISKDIAARLRLDTSLAPAFWNHSPFAYVVPDFDQAVIDGEVALNVVKAHMPVRGIGLVGVAQTQQEVQSVREAGAQTTTYAQGWRVSGASTADAGGHAKLAVRREGSTGSFPDIYAELEQDGISVSLSNIDLARKTQAMARVRQRYDGITDEYEVDLLMDGIEIPDQDLTQPFFISETVVPFGQGKRYATDSGNLAESAVSGAAYANLYIKVNELNCGGVIVITAEAVPDQLWERQRDPFLFITDPDQLPEFLRDYLDPEKVDIVRNGDVDTSHTNPSATFGYEPMNAKWARPRSRVGGKFLRPTVNTGTDEERQRLWAVEKVDPTLSGDFYQVTAMHTKPFLDMESDPFEVAVKGQLKIRGNTQFGGMLVEATGNYEAVAEKAPVERIEKGA